MMIAQRLQPSWPLRDKILGAIEMKLVSHRKHMRTRRNKGKRDREQA